MLSPRRQLGAERLRRRGAQSEGWYLPKTWWMHQIAWTAFQQQWIPEKWIEKDHLHVSMYRLGCTFCNVSSFETNCATWSMHLPLQILLQLTKSAHTLSTSWTHGKIIMQKNNKFPMPGPSCIHIVPVMLAPVRDRRIHLAVVIVQLYASHRSWLLWAAATTAWPSTSS